MDRRSALMQNAKIEELKRENTRLQVLRLLAAIDHSEPCSPVVFRGAVVEARLLLGYRSIFKIGNALLTVNAMRIVHTQSAKGFARDCPFTS